MAGVLTSTSSCLIKECMSSMVDFDSLGIPKTMGGALIKKAPLIGRIRVLESSGILSLRQEKSEVELIVNG